MEPLLWTVVGPGGLLATVVTIARMVAAHKRHVRDIAFCRDMSEKHGVDGLKAAGRITHQWALATKMRWPWRPGRDPDPPQALAAQVPRQAAAPTDESDEPMRTGRTAG